MNKNVKTLVIDQTDLIKQSENKKISELSHTDLRQKSYEAFLAADLVVASNADGQTVLLKNRNGQTGVVVPLDVYQHFVELDEKSKTSIFKKLWPFS